MARRKRKAEAVVDDLAGTVEGLARDHFEREKADYEKRTGEKVLFVPPIPVTRTPIAEPVAANEQPAEELGETESDEAGEGSAAVTDLEGEGTE